MKVLFFVLLIIIASCGDNDSYIYTPNSDLESDSFVKKEYVFSCGKYNRYRECNLNLPGGSFDIEIKEVIKLNKFCIFNYSYGLINERVFYVNRCKVLVKVDYKIGL